MASPYLIGANGAPSAGVVGNPAGNQNPDGATVPFVLGRQGDLIVSPLHGPMGAANQRGMLFFGAASTAGIAIPVNTTTSGSTFALYNPAGSNVNAELVRFKLDFLHTNAAPVTANVIGFSLVKHSLNAPSAITGLAGPTGAGGAAGGVSASLAGNTPGCTLAGAITFASALTVAANWGVPMFSFPASWVPTVGGYPVPLTFDFNGSLIIPPGYTATLVASTAWGANTTVPSLSWMEHRI